MMKESPEFKIIDFQVRKGIFAFDFLTFIDDEKKSSFFNFSIDSDYLIVGILGANIIEYKF